MFGKRRSLKDTFGPRICFRSDTNNNSTSHQISHQSLPLLGIGFRALDWQRADLKIARALSLASEHLEMDTY